MQPRSRCAANAEGVGDIDEWMDHALAARAGHCFAPMIQVARSSRASSHSSRIPDAKHRLEADGCRGVELPPPPPHTTRRTAGNRPCRLQTAAPTPAARTTSRAASAHHRTGEPLRRTSCPAESAGGLLSGRTSARIPPRPYGLQSGSVCMATQHMHIW